LITSFFPIDDKFLKKPSICSEVLTYYLFLHGCVFYIIFIRCLHYTDVIEYNV